MARTDFDLQCADFNIRPMQGIEYFRLALSDRVTPHWRIGSDLPLSPIGPDHGVIGDFLAGCGPPRYLLGLGHARIFGLLQFGHVGKQTAHAGKRIVGHDKIYRVNREFFQYETGCWCVVLSAGCFGLRGHLTTF